MISLSPVLASFLRPVIVPIFTFLGSDSAMFAPTILSRIPAVMPLPWRWPQIRW